MLATGMTGKKRKRGRRGRKSKVGYRFLVLDRELMYVLKVHLQICLTYVGKGINNNYNTLSIDCVGDLQDCSDHRYRATLLGWRLRLLCSLMCRHTPYTLMVFGAYGPHIRSSIRHI